MVFNIGTRGRIGIWCFKIVGISWVELVGSKSLRKKIKKKERKEKNVNDKQSLFNEWENKTHTKNLRITATYISLYHYHKVKFSLEC